MVTRPLCLERLLAFAGLLNLVGERAYSTTYQRHLRLGTGRLNCLGFIIHVHFYTASSVH